MAPREATGAFPDQYLTFDYDASAAIGLPPPHDAPVGQGTTEQQAHDATETNILEGGGHHVQPSMNSTRGAVQTIAHVDPLSIDPTLYQSSPWLPSPDLPFSAESHRSQPSRVVSIPPGGSLGVSRGVPYVESSMASLPRQRSHSSDDMNAQGGGIFPLLSLGSLQPASPVGNVSSSLSSGTNIHSTSRLRLRSYQGTIGSVLDNSTSIESDDDDDEDVPGLDRTFDSAASMPQKIVENTEALEVVTDEEISSDASSCAASSQSSPSLRLIHRNSAFDMANDAPQSPEPSTLLPTAPMSPTSILLSFGPNTTVADLKYFAERGCIVALLQALTTPRLVTLGTRMLADYAKMSDRRVAVASNRRILEFVQRTMLQVSEQSDWLGREYAVETVRSLTATEESDRYLMSTPSLLNTLALVARGRPFVAQGFEGGVRTSLPLASEKAQLHACIAIMNLSCGKANKIEIAKVSDVLEAMRDVMINNHDEARLKATTCIKNLSNADANDSALLGTPGLVEALGLVAAATCSPESGATTCTTNACLALMNLSISKANKHRVFRTPGVMEALMVVLERTTSQGSNNEARIKACSALSNLAIGYDNKIPMFSYPGFVDAILNVIQTDTGEARTKACSILWSFAAEMKNQVPVSFRCTNLSFIQDLSNFRVCLKVVQRGDILPVLVQVAEEDGTTEARFKCVAALTLLAESLENAIPLLEAGALAPLMDILHEAGPDPTQWKGQTASWCVGFLMNIAQSDDAVPTLREAGVVELLTPLLTLDHYQSLKAAMGVTFVCRYDVGDETYDLLRKTENVIPKIISLLHNTLSGRGGNGYKYGVFTLRSSVGCIAALASGPDFMKERIATGPVYESLLRVVSDFCVEGGTPGAIVGGGRDDALSATLAIKALQLLTGHLIPIVGSSSLPFGRSMEGRLIKALESFEDCGHPEVKDETRQLARDARVRVKGGQKGIPLRSGACSMGADGDVEMGDVAQLTSNCCGLDTLPAMGEDFLQALTYNHSDPSSHVVHTHSIVEEDDGKQTVRTFLLADMRSGRRFAVPIEASGGRVFNDNRVWCYRRGRFCLPGEEPDPNFQWNDDLEQAYEAATSGQHIQ